MCFFWTLLFLLSISFSIRWVFYNPWKKNRHHTLRDSMAVTGVQTHTTTTINISPKKASSHSLMSLKTSNSSDFKQPLTWSKEGWPSSKPSHKKFLIQHPILLLTKIGILNKEKSRWRSYSELIGLNCPSNK